MRRTSRRRGWAALSLALLVLNTACTAPTESEPVLQDYGLTSAFELDSSDGSRLDWSSLRGKTVLLFFGFTYCPDVCPMALGRVRQGLELAGDAAKEVVPVMVTVDPARDTAERLREYLEFFELDGVGLTGSEVEVDDVARLFGAYAQRPEEPREETYLVDHSSYIHLIDGEGRLRYLFKTDQGPEVIAEGLRKLAAERR